MRSSRSGRSTSRVLRARKGRSDWPDGNFQGYGRFLTVERPVHFPPQKADLVHVDGDIRTAHIHSRQQNGKRLFIATQMLVKGLLRMKPRATDIIIGRCGRARTRCWWPQSDHRIRASLRRPRTSISWLGRRFEERETVPLRRRGDFTGVNALKDRNPYRRRNASSSNAFSARSRISWGAAHPFDNG